MMQTTTLPSVVVISTCPIVSQESCCHLTFVPPSRFPLKDCEFHKRTFDKGGLTEGASSSTLGSAMMRNCPLVHG
jgi:hypothetical protein